MRLPKLNGWQRLFCALLVFLYIPITVAIFPSNPWLPIPTVSEILKEIPTQTLLLMKENKVKLFIGNELQSSHNVNEKIDWDAYIRSQESNFKRYEIKENEFTSAQIEVSITNELNREKHEEIIDDLYSSFNKAYKKKVYWEQFEFLAIALVFPGILYLLGLTVAWVYRGFQVQNSK